MEHLKYAWQIVSENLVGWILFGAVFFLLSSVTGLLGLLLTPNAIRATRKAIAANAAPELGDLFQFDTIADDAIAVLGFGLAHFLGTLLCGIGALATDSLLLFAPFIVTEGTYDGVGSVKVALEHGKQNIAGNFIQLLLVGGSLVLFTLVTCFLGGLIAVPLALVAAEHFYQEQRPHVFAAAHAAQIPAKG